MYWCKQPLFLFTVSTKAKAGFAGCRKRKVEYFFPKHCPFKNWKWNLSLGQSKIYIASLKPCFKIGFSAICLLLRTLSKCDLNTAQLCVIYRTWCVISEHKEHSVLHWGYNATSSDELKAFRRVWKNEVENQPWGNELLFISINTLLSSIHTMKEKKEYPLSMCLPLLPESTLRFPFLLQYVIQL